VRATRRRVISAGVLVVVLVTGGIVYSVSRTSHLPTVDSLALHGHTPHSVRLAVTLTTGGSLQISGTITLDLTTNALSAQLQVPVVTAATTIDVRAVRDRLYLTSPNLANASGLVWYTENATWPPLAGLSRYLLKPNAAVLTLLANASVTHSGDATTYSFHRAHVDLGTLGVKKTSGSASASGTLDARLTTGGQGQFTALWLSLATASATTTVDLKVTSYNDAVRIVAPPHSRATTSAAPLLRELLTSGALGSIVLPSQILHALNSLSIVKG
jgi:hypothetical protein